MATVTISHIGNDTAGLFVAQVEGFDEIGELTFSRADDGMVVVDHIRVPEALRGRGVSEALAERLVAAARSEGFRIVPSSPLFAALAEAHPDWADAVSRSGEA